MSESIAKIWNEEYQKGKYDGEGPIPFVDTIVNTVDQENLREGIGLYVGCGNGRNYVPMLEKGLDVVGLDVSLNGLRQIKERYATSKLVESGYLDYHPEKPFDYVISIQVFQHGNLEAAKKYFSKTSELLAPGGLFFLRVNSINTDIFFEHSEDRETNEGGLTVTYNDGPKDSLDVHFFSEQELDRLTQDDFDVVTPLKEVVIERTSPQKGQWTQWEGIYRRK